MREREREREKERGGRERNRERGERGGGGSPVLSPPNSEPKSHQALLPGPAQAPALTLDWSATSGWGPACLFSSGPMFTAPDANRDPFIF